MQKKIKNPFKKEKRDILLDKGSIGLEIFLVFVIVLIEIFEFVTGILWKIIPFKKEIRGVKTWFKTTRVYAGYKKFTEKALGLDDKDFVWLILGMAILAIPFIYVLPFLFTGIIFKIIFIVIGKLISSTATTLIALGADKLLNIEFISNIWQKAKKIWQKAKVKFANLKYIKLYKEWTSSQEVSFIDRMKYIAKNIRNKEWRDTHISKFNSFLSKISLINRFAMFSLFAYIVHLLDAFLYLFIAIFILLTIKTFKVYRKTGVTHADSSNSARQD